MFGLVRHRGCFVGRVERLGSPRPGTLRLTCDALEFAPASGPVRRWPLAEISAVQASSGTLQVKPRRQPLAAFRFPEGSVRLWEELLREALRRFYRSAGRGEIMEFQPRIVAR